MINCLLLGSESDMDIKKELHPLSHYIYDRNELINQAFKVIGEYILLLNVILFPKVFKEITQVLNASLDSQMKDTFN